MESISESLENKLKKAEESKPNKWQWFPALGAVLIYMDSLRGKPTIMKDYFHESAILHAAGFIGIVMGTYIFYTN